MTHAATMTAPARALDWPDFEARLAETLSRLPVDQYLIVSTPERRGRHAYYVQFAQCGPAGFRAEAVSNDYLPGPSQLAPALERAMLAIGWQAPDRHSKKPQNYEREWPQETPFGDVAALAVRTLREVYAVATPADLRYHRFTRSSGDPIPEPGLGLRREPARKRRAPTPTPGGSGELSTDLGALVGRALLESDVTARVERMGHDAWRTMVNDVQLFVRVLPDEPAAVRIYASVLRQPSSPELLVALNDLNTQFSFGRALHVNGEAMVAMEVAAPHVSAFVIGAACEALARMTIHAMTSLASWLVPMTAEADATPALLN